MIILLKLSSGIESYVGMFTFSTPRVEIDKDIHPNSYNEIIFPAFYFILNDSAPFLFI